MSSGEWQWIHDELTHARLKLLNVVAKLREGQKGGDRHATAALEMIEGADEILSGAYPVIRCQVAKAPTAAAEGVTRG